MEDLFPLLVVLAIGAVNLLNFMAKKGKQSRQAERSNEPKRAPSQLERFFEQLSEQLNPQEPTELPDWPEGYERPDYIHEMEEFEEPQAETAPETLPEIHHPEPPATVSTTTPSTAGRLRVFRSDGKRGLRQAMLAHIVLSPPRALDDTLPK